MSCGRWPPSLGARLTRLMFTTQETETTKTSGPRKDHIQPSMTSRKFHKKNTENELQEKQVMGSRVLAAFPKRSGVQCPTFSSVAGIKKQKTKQKPDKQQLRGERIYSAYTSRSITEEKSRQEPEIANHKVISRE